MVPRPNVSILMAGAEGMCPADGEAVFKHVAPDVRGVVAWPPGSDFAALFRLVLWGHAARYTMLKAGAAAVGLSTPAARPPAPRNLGEPH